MSRRRRRSVLRALKNQLCQLRRRRAQRRIRERARYWQGFEYLESRQLLSATINAADYVDLSLGNWWQLEGTSNLSQTDALLKMVDQQNINGHLATRMEMSIPAIGNYLINNRYLELGADGLKLYREEYHRPYYDQQTTYDNPILYIPAHMTEDVAYNFYGTGTGVATDGSGTGTIQGTSTFTGFESYVTSAGTFTAAKIQIQSHWEEQYNTGYSGHGDITEIFYMVEELGFVGWSRTEHAYYSWGEQDHDVTQLSLTDSNLLNAPVASLSGVVWEDENEDGIRHATEQTLQGITVNLYNHYGSLVASTATNAQGQYTFDHLVAGNYQIAVESTDQYTFTQAGQGSDDTIDSNVNQGNGYSSYYTLGFGEDLQHVDAGLISNPVGSVSGVLWDDQNQDGLQNNNEPGLNNISVDLYKDGGLPIATVTTDSSGRYLFEGLASGNYKIKATRPLGFVFSEDNVGNDDTNDSDFLAETSTTDWINLNDDEQLSHVDAGLYNPAPVYEGDVYRMHENGQDLELDSDDFLDEADDYLIYRWDLDADGLYDEVGGFFPTLTWQELEDAGVTSGVHTLGLSFTDTYGNVGTTEINLFIREESFTGDVELSDIYSGSLDGAIFNGMNPSDYSGAAVSNAGDINGDNYDDFLIAARGADENGSSSGAVYLVYGSPGRMAGEYELADFAQGLVAGAVFYGIEESSHLGISVASAGDVDGDGKDDLIIGASNFQSQYDVPGATYLIYGHETELRGAINIADIASSQLRGAAINGYNAYRIGEVVSSAGDVDHDGYDDLLIGAPDLGPAGEYSGAAYLVYGGSSALIGEMSISSLLDSGGATLFRGVQTRALAGYSLSSAGDVDHDGYDDFLIGAVYTNHRNENTGATYLIYGQQSRFGQSTNLSGVTYNLPRGAVFYGVDPDEHTGYSVACAGDVNNDGYDDILIASGNGRATYLVFGQESGLTGSIELSGISDGTLQGAVFDIEGSYRSEVSMAGDVNSDGYADFLIGAAEASSNGTYSGKTCLVYGQPYGLTGELDLSENDWGGTMTVFHGENAGHYSGASVSYAGDVNDDGYADLLVGAYKAESWAGKTYLVYGVEDQGAYAPVGHELLESLTGLVYNETGWGAALPSLGFFNASVSLFDDNADSGLFAMGITSTNYDPVLVFRGTESDSPIDIAADFHVSGAGWTQLIASRSVRNSQNQTIEQWLNGVSMNQDHVTLTGHSLGGALAQWFAAETTFHDITIGDVVTFNAPGISSTYAQMFDASLAGQVHHYITSGDFVSLAGEAFLEGSWTLTTLSSTNPVVWHTQPVLGYGYDQQDFSSVNTDGPYGLALNDPLFHYANSKYLSYLAGLLVSGINHSKLAQTVSGALFRQSAEEARKNVGTPIWEWMFETDVDPYAGPLQIALPDIDIDVFGLPVFKADGMYMKYDGQSGEYIFQGMASLPQFFNATADLSGENFIQITDQGWELVGRFSVENIPLSPPFWGIAEAFIEIDTITDQITGGGELTMPGGMRVDASLGVYDGLFNSVTLGVNGLGIPIANTGFILQDIGGQVDHVAQSDPQPLLFGGDVAVTGGPEYTIDLPLWAGGSYQGSLLRIDVAADINKYRLYGEGLVTILNGLGTIDAQAELNWHYGFMQVDGQMNLLDGLVTGALAMRVDRQLNLNASGEAAIGVPDWVPIVGGKDALSGNFQLDFSNDDNLANDYVAAWSTFDLGPAGEKTLGWKIGFDGQYRSLGAEDITAGDIQVQTVQAASVASLSSFETLPVIASAMASGNWVTVGQDTPWVLMSVNWENAADDVPIQLQTPSGLINEADFDNYPDIAVVEALSNGITKVIAINAPETGQYQLIIPDDTGLGQVTFEAIGGTNAPVVEIDSVVMQVDNTSVSIAYTAVDADSQATIKLFYDSDRQGFDGMPIASGLIENDGHGNYLWDITGVTPDNYYVYAIIDDGINAPVASYVSDPITIQSAMISDVVWVDGNFDQSINNGELGLHGAAVNLYLDNGDGMFHAIADDLLLENSETDSTGSYMFANLSVGDYWVVLDMHDNDLTDIETTTPSQYLVSIVSGQSLASTPFGVVQIAGVDVHLRSRLTSSDVVTLDALPTADINSTDGTGGSPFAQREGTDFYVEIWVRSDQTNADGISSGSVELTFDAAYGQVMSVEHGELYTDSPIEVIDNSTGRIHIGGATAQTDQGDDEYVLLGRVVFQGQVPVDEVNHVWATQNLNLQVNESSLTFELNEMGEVTGTLQEVPTISIRPMIYDVNDDGRVNFSDLGMFASAFRAGAVNDDGPPYTRWADFNNDGRVNFSDLGLFASAFRGGANDTPDVPFPDWWKQSHAVVQMQSSSAPQTAANQLSLVQEDGSNDLALALAVASSPSRVASNLANLSSHLQLQLVGEEDDEQGNSIGQWIKTEKYILHDM